MVWLHSAHLLFVRGVDQRRWVSTDKITLLRVNTQLLYAWHALAIVTQAMTKDHGWLAGWLAGSGSKQSSWT